MRDFLADLLLVLFIATLTVGVGSNASAGKGEDVRFRRGGDSAAIGADTLLTDALRRLIASARHPYLRWPKYPDYRVELDASPGDRFSAETQAVFWQRQRQYWVDMAAVFGVREAEEAVSGGNPDP